MAKTFKVSMYLVDPHFETMNDKVLAHALEEKFKEMDLIVHQFHLEGSEEYSWNRRTPEGMSNCDLAMLEKRFNPVTDVMRTGQMIIPGKTYRHFKGKEVVVIGISKDTEHPAHLCVVYQHKETGEIWHRPYEMFASRVDKRKYPNATQEFRFELV